MSDFMSASEKHLPLLHEKLRAVLYDAKELYNFRIISSYRGQPEQDELFGRGVSKKKYPNSKHNTNPSLAVDLVPYPIDWEDRERFYFLAGTIITVAKWKGINIRWGGDWDSDRDFNDNRFDDLGHFELIG